MKTYNCECPVCGKPTKVEADFMSCSIYTTSGKPSMPCHMKHTVKEVREALHIPIGNMNPNALVSGEALV